MDMSAKSYCSSNSEVSDAGDDIYCIFLHIAEGVGFNTKDIIGDHKELNTPNVLLRASLNGVQFEIDGHCANLDTKFNSNCIWECKMNDIKRMKTDNRPIKLECYSKCHRSDILVCDKLIGTLLLPIKCVPLSSKITYGPPELKWHKLGALSAEWRYSKPELNLLLMIVKKSIIERGQMEVYLRRNISKGLSPKISDTSEMLQSQKNIYIRLLEQDGLIQVGNNPKLDCEMFRLSITFKHVCNIDSLLSPKSQHSQGGGKRIVFSYDLLGQIANIDINDGGEDLYVVNEKISVNFKSSFKCLREYFKKVFYIPISIYNNGFAVAKDNFEFGTQLPIKNNYFNGETQMWSNSGEFHFVTVPTSGREEEKVSKLLLEYVISIQCLMDRNIKCESPSVTSVEQIQQVELLELDQLSDEKDNGFSLESVDLCPLPSKQSPIGVNSTPALCTIGTNTDPSDFIDYEDLSLKVVEELELWKAQQMQNFLREINRKEDQFKKCFQQNCLSLLKRLETKIVLCDELNLQLKNMSKEFNESTSKNQEHLKIFDNMRHKIESTYEKKFMEIAAQMERLKLEILEKEKSTDIDHVRSDELKQDNEHLRKETNDLKEQIKVLQQNLILSQSTNVPIKQLINIISDLGKQSERLNAAEKSSTFYQEQWSDVSKEINKIKFELIKMQEEKFAVKDMRSNEMNIFINELLNDEQKCLNSERSELKSIREELLKSLERDEDDENNI